VGLNPLNSLQPGKKSRHQLEASNLDFIRTKTIRSGIERIFRGRALKLAQGLPVDDDFEPWVIRHYRNEKNLGTHVLSHREMIISGMLQPNFLDDWEVDRPKDEVGRRLGVRSLKQLQMMIQSRTTGPRISIEIGPGDGLLSRAMDEESPDWMHWGIGDRLYFSMEKLLMTFALPTDNPDLQKFMKIFFLFAKREFRKRYNDQLGREISQDKTIDLNELYDIFSSVKEWIGAHFDPHHGSFRISNEFEFDTPCSMSPGVLQLFKELLDGDNPLDFFRRFMKPQFLEMFMLPFSDRLDLNAYPSFSDKGFFPMKFQDIDQMVYHKGMTMREQVDLVFGCRSDSHLNGDEYRDFLTKVIDFLKPGGVYISDGVRESYTRILRFQTVLDILTNGKEQGKYRALAVVDKVSGAPLSVYIEAGVQSGESYSFASDSELSKTFDSAVVEVLPLEMVIERERFETHLRTEIFEELECSRQAFYIINDAIHEAAQFVKTASPLDLLAGIEHAETFLEQNRDLDADIIYSCEIFCEVIVAYGELQLEKKVHEPKILTSPKNKPRRRVRRPEIFKRLSKVFSASKSDIF